MEGSPLDTNAQLANELRGQTLVVPSMQGLLKGWPSGRRNKHYDRLRHLCDGLIDCTVSEEKRRQHFKKSDFALFTSIWFPDATWENLHTAGLLSLWAFIWDDTIDTNEHSLANDFEQACIFRARSLIYCRYWLDVVDKEASPLWSPLAVVKRGLNASLSCFGYRALPPPSPADGCTIFKELGERLCQKFDYAQQQRVYREIKYFFTCAEQEQHERLIGHIPTCDDYLTNRMGTTAFRIFACVTEIPAETHLPPRIIDSPEMEIIWHEANMIIILYNDIYSLKKEMATDCMINLVSIMYYHGEKSLDTIVAKLITDVKKSRARFDRAAEAIRRMAEGDAALKVQVESYLKSIMETVTGTHEYSLVSKRYGIQNDVKPDGSAVITL